MTSTSTEYSYDGWLVFNELLSTEVHGDDVNSSSIVDSFDSYTQGTPNDPSRGFERLDFPDQLASIEDLTHELRDLSRHLYAFR